MMSSCTGCSAPLKWNTEREDTRSSRRTSMTLGSVISERKSWARGCGDGCKSAPHDALPSSEGGVRERESTQTLSHEGKHDLSLCVGVCVCVLGQKTRKERVICLRRKYTGSVQCVIWLPVTDSWRSHRASLHLRTNVTAYITADVYLINVSLLCWTKSYRFHSLLQLFIYCIFSVMLYFLCLCFIYLKDSIKEE